MKLILFILLWLVLSANCFARTEIGIGLVEINFDDKTVLQFYENPALSKSFGRIEFFDDKSINSWNIRNLEKEKVWLSPEVLWLDYSSFIFRCTARRQNWYQVIVNNESGKTLWLRKQKAVEFKTWEQFLKEMFGVERLGAQKIRQAPLINSREIKYRGKDCFQVRRLKGDWIEIFSPAYCKNGYTESKTPVKSGWIKWRAGNKLLIDYFITS